MQRSNAVSSLGFNSSQSISVFANREYETEEDPLGISCNLPACEPGVFGS